MPEFERDGLHLRYGTWGESGPTVVLLHGLQGRGSLWAAVAQGLVARGYRCVAPDLRGHGASAHTGDYRLAAFVGDAVALVEHLGAGPVHLIGHSLGGRIAWEVAAARPDLIRSLVIEDQHPDARPESLPYWQEWVQTWPRHFATRAAGLAYLEAEGRSLPWWEPSLVPLPAGGWGWAMDIDGVGATARSLSSEAGWASLGRVQAPTLLIRGGRSEHLRADVAERMVATLPRGRLFTFPESGHWVHRDPDPYVAAVADFLATYDGAMCMLRKRPPTRRSIPQTL